MEKDKKVELSKEELYALSLAAMYELSDGLEWRLASDPEDKPGNSLIMESPETIAESIVQKVFQLPDSEDSSASSGAAS